MSLVEMSLAKENLRDRKTNTNPVSSGHVEGPRKSLHRPIPVAENKQRVPSSSEYFNTVAAEFFG